MDTCPDGSDRSFGPRVDPGCRSLDFTLQFEDFFFACLPAALFILLSTWSLITLLQRQARFSLCSKLLASKLAALTVLLAAYLALLVLRVQNQSFTTSASLAADVLYVIATSIALTLSFLDHQRSLRPSTIFSLYLSASVIFGAARTRTLWLMGSRSPVPVAMTVALAFTVTTLLLQSTKKNIISSPQNPSFAPEQLSGIWNRTIFAWIIPTLRAGYARIISLHDLPILDTKLESRYMQEKLNATWAKYNYRSRYSLLRACFRAYLFSFMGPIIPRLCLATITFSQPLLVNTTVNFVGQTDPDPNYGKGLVGAWALVYLGIAVSKSIYWYQNFRFTTRLRGGLIALVYQQSLRVRAFESGEITAVALMSTDVERLVNGMLSFHEVWASLLHIAIAAWLLGLQLSVACLAPILLVTVFVVATSKISVAAKNAQVDWIEKVQERLRVTSTMLRDMKAVKMTGLSGVMFDIIQSLRMGEIKTSRAYRKLLTAMVFLSLTPINLAPVLTFAVYTIIAVFWKHESLLTARAFTSISLITLLTSPVVIFIQALPNVVQCLGMFDRIQEFCNSTARESTKEENTYITDYQTGSDINSLTMKSTGTQSTQIWGREHISLSGQSFSWHKRQSAILKDLNVKLHRGSITAIVGPVGSGKSSFLCSLLGEMISIPSGKDPVRLRLSEPIAYCAQQPWLENGTICQNIIGVSPYDEQWYSAVKAACGLDVDTEKLEKGDQTCVGSDGLNLSGGQKQRVALARAVYSRQNIVLLDDVFSGMDAHTADLVSSRLLGRHGFLRKNHMTVVVATHSHKIIALADSIIVLEGGIITEIGSPANLLASDGYINRLGFKLFSDGEPAEESPQSRGVLHSSEFTQVSKEVRKETRKAPADLRRKNGDIAVYKYYLTSAGYGAVGLYIGFVTLWEFCTNFSSIILKWWSEANSEEPNRDAGMWMGLYAMLGVLGTLGVFVAAWVAFVFVISNTAARLHLDLLQSTLKSSFQFLTTMDHGELLNRFSQDMELIDMELPIVMVNYTSTAVSCIISLIILAIFSKYLGVAVPFLAIAVYFLQRFYLQTSRQVRLLSIEARAPLYSHFTESVAGAMTIRAFGWESQFEERCYHHIDVSQKPAYLQSCIQHWLGFVLDVMVAVLAIALVGTVLTWHDKFSAGSAGVSLIMVMGFNEIIARLIQNWTKLESSVGAVTRVMRFIGESDSEDIQSRHAIMPLEWPQTGAVDFLNVVASYGSPATPVLRNISLSVRPGEHIAICGRTGSGKTSLALSLLQMTDIQEGQIVVDGIDASTVTREDLRARLNVVPQDPFLMPGTIRFNIDPFRGASDHQITQTLVRVGVWDMIRDQGGLDKEIDIAAWSAGQKQLLCLSRAMVRKCRILILDEMASSVDSETESKIQEIIDTEFKDCTVLAVMHRLKHVMRYDSVALLNDGVLLEYDQPASLINRPTRFAELYKSNIG
ncbi:uncharacterized protein Z518_08954 [Rhinocladiella mackenziei CBS 650.93]|uniref:Rhinocladiella mackenziei CBS 650.93 unplaced genomic scaffold supercont1.7, whole genome shotgun sequence n=1 Tax=Rhinocladiella mackenziei CBS 650.93 TaxID=1442369 RepID=A0A0D2I5Z8_9EURO|nr:uncharacterized protein Z518_08954 [Rhinocladiella mackenziei CBS 650.93]KIX01229.1 hypothetical protein Z518_08954 [Rhinocladiella mackenziei CBS 650.93]